jgi:hypothetical protein
MSNMSISNPDYLRFREWLAGSTVIDQFAFTTWLLANRTALQVAFRATEDYRRDYLPQALNGNLDVEHVERCWTRARFLEWKQIQETGGLLDAVRQDDATRQKAKAALSRLLYGGNPHAG